MRSWPSPGIQTIEHSPHFVRPENRPRDALACVRVLQEPLPVPDHAPDVQLVAENADAARRVTVNGARAPQGATGTAQSIPNRILRDVFGPRLKRSSASAMTMSNFFWSASRFIAWKPGRTIIRTEVLGVTQPKVSALRNYKLAGFSVERLMNLLTALDQDIEIVIRRKSRSRKGGRITVVAA
jgi:hypothetical protein